MASSLLMMAQKTSLFNISALEKAGLRQLNDGQKVSYQIETNNGKTSAVDIQLQDG